MARGLTRKQQAVLSLVEGYWREHGVAPSLSDLAGELGTAKTTVHGHLLALAKKGFVVHAEGKGRTWRPVSVAPRAGQARVPVVGRIAAGLPILAQENIEGWITVDQRRGSDVLFALRVRGTSMTGAGILDGDLVIVRQQQTAEPGDIVVALVGGEEATVKRLGRGGETVVLKPENPEAECIELPAERVSIQGKVIGVQRHLEEAMTRDPQHEEYEP